MYRARNPVAAPAAKISQHADNHNQICSIVLPRRARAVRAARAHIPRGIYRPAPAEAAADRFSSD